MECKNQENYRVVQFKTKRVLCDFLNGGFSNCFAFYFSCVERWLKDPKNKCCPQCKKKAKRTDIRNIYAKALKAYDTTETEQ